MVQMNYNAQQYAPRYESSGGLPPGKGYIGMITQTSGEETQDKQGGYLALTITCLDGPCKDQTQVDRLNIHNKSPVAVKIANEQLSAYCHVTGVFVLQDSDQLCGKPFKFDVRQQANNPQYTEVYAVYDINGNKPGQAGLQQQQNNNQPPPVNQPQLNTGGWQGGGSAGGDPNAGGAGPTTWNPNPNPQPDPSQAQGGGAWQPGQGGSGGPAQGSGGGWNAGAGGPAAGGGGGWNNR